MSDKAMTTTENTVCPQNGNGEMQAAHSNTRYVEPVFDIRESDEAIQLIADMPGVPKEGLDVKLEDGVLTVTGNMGTWDHGELIHQEFGNYSYFRRFRIRDSIDEDGIQAMIRNGVLAIHLPKAERAKPKQIEIKVA